MQVFGELLKLILQVKDDERRLGYSTKDHLIAVAEYIATNYQGIGYSKEEYNEAIILLAKYRMAPLADRIRGRKLIAAEKAKSYFARCCNCGLPISSPESLKTGLGVVCRKRLGVKVSKTKTDQRGDPLVL